MLIVISPAKTLDFENPPSTLKHTQPQFLEQAEELNLLLREYSPQRLGKLMSISRPLSDLNVQRNHQWETPFTISNAKQALFAFRGDVYTGLQADSFTKDDIAFAQKHLRILSGLYGLLRPLDLIQAYRLEMGSKLVNEKGKNLYEFWGDTITKALKKSLKTHSEQVLINLASEEYFSSVKQEILNANIITPVFKDKKNGQYKIISFFAKKARGAMSSWIIKNQIDSLEALKTFSWEGYQFNKRMSSAGEIVFVRELG